MSRVPVETNYLRDGREQSGKAGSELRRFSDYKFAISAAQASCNHLCRALMEMPGIANVAGYQMAHESLGGSSTGEFDHTFKTNVYALF